MSDGHRSHHIPLNGVAIKMITILTIKKYMKSPGNYDSYLVFNLEQFFHCHLFVLGDPSCSVHTSEAAAATVLIEEDIIKLDLHEGGAWRQHLIMALSTNSASEGNRRQGRKSGSLTKDLYMAKQTYSFCAKHFEERPRSEAHHSRATWPERGRRFCMWCHCDISAFSLPFTDYSLSLSLLHTHSISTSKQWAQGPGLYKDDGMPGMLVGSCSQLLCARHVRPQAGRAK